MRSNPDRAEQVPSFDTVGENLVAVASGTINYTRYIERSWFNQRFIYNYTENSCSSPNACLSYTQVGKVHS